MQKTLFEGLLDVQLPCGCRLTFDLEGVVNDTFLQQSYLTDYKVIDVKRCDKHKHLSQEVYEEQIVEPVLEKIHEIGIENVADYVDRNEVLHIEPT